MTRNILIVLFLFGSLDVNSQAYRPLVKEGASWYELSSQADHLNTGLVYHGYQFYLMNDTIINGYYFKKLFVTNTDTTLIADSNNYVAGYMREDSLSRIFILPNKSGYFANQEIGEPNDSSGILLYDFSMDVGDTIFRFIYKNGDSSYYTLKEIDTVSISGISIRKFTYYTRLLGEDVVFESIGSTHGFSFYDPIGGGTILGCYIDSLIYYKDYRVKSCQYLSLDEILPDKVSCFPNPTLGNFNVELDKAYQEIELSIRDISGKVISIQKFQNTEEIQSEINGEAGVYFVLLSSNEAYLRTVKVIKQ